MILNNQFKEVLNNINWASKQFENLSRMMPGAYVKVDLESNEIKVITGTLPDRTESVANPILTDPQTTLNWIGVFNESTQANIKKFRALILKNPDSKAKQDGLYVLAQLNKNLMSASQGLEELYRSFPGETETEKKEMRESHLGQKKFIEEMMMPEIKEAKRELGAQLQIAQVMHKEGLTSLVAKEIAKVKDAANIAFLKETGPRRTSADLPRLVSKPSPERPFFMYEQPSTVASLASLAKMVQGGEINDISEVSIGIFKVPAQFMTDLPRFGVIKLNGKSLLANKDTENLSGVYQALADAIGGTKQGFQLASLLTQTAYRDITDLVGHYFIEKEIMYNSPSGMHAAIDVKDGNVVITYKICIAGWDPKGLELNPGAFLAKRVITVPFSQFQVLNLKDLSQPFPVGSGSDYFSSFIRAGEYAEKLLDKF